MINNKEFIQTWFQRVWNEDDDNAIHDMFEGGQVEGLGEQTTINPDDFKIFKGALRNLICDINVNVDKCIEDGPWVSALCTIHAKSIASGAKLKVTGNVWTRIEDGKIQEAYNHFDFMTLWGQLGYLPTDCFEQGLMGTKIA